ncbi:MAG: phosphoribosylformylglycinamidine synthase subunit PurQ [Bacillota bacterium]|jgi:phosphoribosylformylglycinamidine synthase I|nr:phosphoribosylformylglycinamidine synthase subunit PurQ [Candidatus Fermentithermobacillaceae bacterium]
MRFGVVVFPGSNCDTDAYHAIKDVAGVQCEHVWHTTTDLSGFDAIVLPGGFSYGDYLRCGALARFSPVMESLYGFVEKGRLVIGICNGFQVLLEAGLLPGAMLANDVLEFRCQWVNLKVENNKTPFTLLYDPGEVIRFPIAHGEGNYYAEPDVLDELERTGRVVLRYVDGSGRPTREANPNGAARNIAGIINEKGNVLGLMPHPERCAESILGGEDGRRVFLSMIKSLESGALASR